MQIGWLLVCLHRYKMVQALAFNSRGSKKLGIWNTSNHVLAQHVVLWSMDDLIVWLEQLQQLLYSFTLYVEIKVNLYLFFHIHFSADFLYFLYFFKYTYFIFLFHLNIIFFIYFLSFLYSFIVERGIFYYLFILMWNTGLDWKVRCTICTSHNFFFFFYETSHNFFFLKWKSIGVVYIIKKKKKSKYNHFHTHTHTNPNVGLGIPQGANSPQGSTAQPTIQLLAILAILGMACWISQKQKNQNIMNNWEKNKFLWQIKF